MRRYALPVAVIGGTLVAVAAASILVDRSALPAEDLDIGDRAACDLLTGADLRALGFGDVLPDAHDDFCAWSAGPLRASPLMVSLDRFDEYGEFAERVNGPRLAGYPAARHPGLIAVAYADPGVFTVVGEDDSVTTDAAARILTTLRT
ncbi:hypothetical protein AB0I28_28675 [Phytomonospora sp. NPDC050363]|uniref:hypothetical protein n=1 Tax=Phytomonospora sp. NPDC050363 TaxID=3155642 RepID=UPI0033CC1C96